MAKKEEITANSFMPKIVSFTGVERGDIVYYTAKLLAAGNKSVLCIDNAKRHDLFETVKEDMTGKAAKGERQEKRYVNHFRFKGSIVYTKNALYSRDAFERFDYVLIYHGMDIDKLLFKKSDVRFVMTDTDRFNREDLSRALSAIKEELPVYALFVDVFYGKIREKEFVESLVENEEHLLGSATLSFDPVDVEAKQAWQYNGAQKVKVLSPSMKELLLFVNETITGVKNQKPKKLIADAQ